MVQAQNGMDFDPPRRGRVARLPGDAVAVPLDGSGRVSELRVRAGGSAPPCSSDAALVDGRPRSLARMLWNRPRRVNRTARGHRREPVAQPPAKGDAALTLRGAAPIMAASEVAMADCLFCKIRDGAIPAKRVHEDDRCIAFLDINPQAPLHALVVPRKHIASLLDLGPEDHELVGHMHGVAVQIARANGHADDGFRVLFNTGRNAGQSVWHIHLHVLGGRPLGWPPG